MFVSSNKFKKDISRYTCRTVRPAGNVKEIFHIFHINLIKYVEVTELTTKYHMRTTTRFCTEGILCDSSLGF